MKNKIILFSVIVIFFNRICLAQIEIKIDFQDFRDSIETQALTEEGFNIMIHNIEPESEKMNVRNYVFFQHKGDNSQEIENEITEETNNTITFKIKNINTQASSISIKDKTDQLKTIIVLTTNGENKKTPNLSQSTEIDVEITGIPIYDAFELKRLMDLGDTTTVKKILNFYSNEEKYNDNPLFIKAGLIPFNKVEANSFIGSTFSKLVSQVGGTNVTTFVDGIAQFIIERATEELNVAFFNRLKKQFDQYPEFEILFPNTFKFLAKIEASMYASILQALQEAFKKDCIELSYNLTKLQLLTKRDCDTKCENDCINDCEERNGKNCNEKCNKKLKKCKNTCKEINTRIDGYKKMFSTPEGLSFLSLLFVTDGLIKGKNPIDIVVILSDSIDYRNENLNLNFPSNYVHSLRLIKLIFESIRSKNREEVFASQLDIKKVLTDEITFKIYLGLLYEQNEKLDIFFTIGSDTIRFKQTLKNYANSDSLNNPIQYFENVSVSIAEINQNVKEIKTIVGNGGTFKYTNYTNYYNSLINLAENIISFNQINASIDISTAKITHYLSNARLLGQVYYDISNRNYSSALINSISLLEEETSDIFSPLIREAKSSLNRDSLTKNEKKQLEETIENNESYHLLINNLTKYGNFIGTVAQAQSADEVKSAIEAVALPTGSSSIKKKTPFNIALNAYIGGHAGHENVEGSQEIILSDGINSAGIFTPVGITFSTGLFRNKNYSTSISLLGSIIDISAVTTYRLDSSDTNINAEITLENIISPGGYLIIGLPYMPLSLGFGAQINPNLRKVTADGIDISVDKYTRFSIFLAVDIPIFNLYTVPKKKR